MGNTQYVVLRREVSSGLWDFASKQEAGSREAAARRAAEADEVEGEYVAVPARSFQPLLIAFEATPRAVVTAAVSVAG